MKSQAALRKILVAAVLLMGTVSTSAQENPCLPVTVEGTGNYFVITGDENLNMTLESTALITLQLDAVPGAVMMLVEAADGAMESEILISGLFAEAQYYKYEDDYRNLELVNTDENGSITFTQDLCEAHLVILQSHHSTKYIPGDTTIGTWDAVTSTYTLTTDVNETIQINESNLTLDGAGYRVSLPAPIPAYSTGVYLYGKTGVTIKNCVFEGFYFAARVYSCNNITLSGNIFDRNLLHVYFHNGSSNSTITGNVMADSNPGGYGCFLRYSCSYNTVINNNFHDNPVGCFMESGSHYNTVSGNSMSDALYYGCLVKAYSNYNTVTSNTMENNGIGCYVTSSSYYNTVTQNNFISNATQAKVDGGSSGNVFYLAAPAGGNFWDNWTSPDSNLDGFVDSPYTFYGGADYLPHVTVLALNQPPLADAGEDQTAYRGQDVILDASGCSDPDANYPLGYWWYMISRPAGSLTALSGYDTMTPSLIPDVLGEYVFKLAVIDSSGQLSVPDTVIISTENAVPVAYAGEDQVVILQGSTVTLGDYPDVPGYDPDGDPISILWTITAKPVGSAAVLDDPAALYPTFVADLYGTYEISLVVTDSLGADSDPDTVTVSFTNVKPVADAGFNQAKVAGDAVVLDGSASNDANGDPLSYAWNLVSMPPESLAVLNNADQPVADFITDVPGTFVVSLVVNDGLLDSDSSNATIEVISVEDALSLTLMEMIEEVNLLLPGDFKNKNMRKPLTKKISVILKMIDKGNYFAALEKINSDVLLKMDGCAEIGEPDQNDWLVNCDAQNEIYPLLEEAVYYLNDLQ